VAKIRLIINFFLGTGCRLSTLTSVRIGDIDRENELIAYTHTKNKKAQTVKGTGIDFATCLTVAEIFMV